MLNHANSSKQVVQAFTGTNALVTGTPLFAFAGGEVWIGDTRGQISFIFTMQQYPQVHFSVTGR